MSKLNSILSEASQVIKLEFNLELSKSRLKNYSEDNWNKFCMVNNFEVDSQGIYIPSSYSAYVKVESPVLLANIFHELYGHGLFCEYSEMGKKLTDIIKNKEDEHSFLFDEINSKEQPLGLCRKNIQNYEGFAVWLEDLLCEETNNSDIFEKKKNFMYKDSLDLLDYFKGVEENISRFGLIGQMGFPKFYDDSKVLEVLKKINGSVFDNAEFIVLYGSQKPESDIDLFVVSSNESYNYFNGWLDIYNVNREEFMVWSKNLDISITDPLFSGRLIYGDKNNFEHEKNKIMEQPITKDAVNYNLKEAERLKNHKSNSKHEEKNRISYVNSFSRNAELLSLGKKSLTFANL